MESYIEKLANTYANGVKERLLGMNIEESLIEYTINWCKESFKSGMITATKGILTMVEKTLDDNS